MKVTTNNLFIISGIYYYLLSDSGYVRWQDITLKNKNNIYEIMANGLARTL